MSGPFGITPGTRSRGLDGCKRAHVGRSVYFRRRSRLAGGCEISESVAERLRPWLLMFGDECIAPFDDTSIGCGAAR